MAQFLFEDISRAIAVGLKERTKRRAKINMQTLRLDIKTFSDFWMVSYNRYSNI
jgi:hypothetical protein